MTTTFADLGVDGDLVDALAQRDILVPFPIQELAIADALAGRDVCGKAKTGSGKTLAFGLPILQRGEQADPRRPRALVLVPTRELAQQVTEELAPLGAGRGVRVVAIYGGANFEKQVMQLTRGAEVVVATPGRMIDLLERGEVNLTDITTVVIDEADRMADMGFLPQVEWILRRVGSRHQTLLFSATLDGVVQGLIDRYQTDPVRHEVASRDVTVDEMIHRFVLVHEMDKVKVAAAIARNVDRTLIFVRTKRGADRLVRHLAADGVKVAAIHGDLRQQMREKALADFIAGTLPVLVATDVAARGIYVDDIDVVVHYDPPEDSKAYLHRSGRTARAGRAAWSPPSSSGIRSWRSVVSRTASGSSCPSSRCSPTTPAWPTSAVGIPWLTATSPEPNGTADRRDPPPVVTIDPAHHPAWAEYRDGLGARFADAGGGDGARAVLVAAVVRHVEPTAPLHDLDPHDGAGAADRPAPPDELLVPELPGLVLEHLLDPARRRRGGVHHTPSPVATALTEIALGPLERVTGAVTICDPALGGGAFLLAAARALSRRGAEVGTILSSLYGADLDPLAVATTRAALACWAIREGSRPDEASAPHLVVADGLAGDRSPWPAASADGFDVVIGNSPFLSQLGRTTARTAADRSRLAARFGPAAVGYGDTAGLFLLAAIGLVREGGRVAMIQPESLLAARDAGGVRAAVEAAGGLTDLWVAGTGLQPGCGCAPPPHRRPPVVVDAAPGAAFEPLRPGCPSGAETGNWSMLTRSAYATPVVALAADSGTLADLATATAGFRNEFYGLVPHVREGAEGSAADHDGRCGTGTDLAPLVTVGAIDPLWCSWGAGPVRFAGRRWTRPVVDLTSLTGDPTLHRWVVDRLVPKVLVATQTRVVEAVVDEEGAFVPSVPTIAVAADPADQGDRRRPVLPARVGLGAGTHGGGSPRLRRHQAVRPLGAGHPPPDRRRSMADGHPPARRG
ncbi:MAG: DEAD/DEAH box helicase [Acidimicrobiales bacterium]